MPTMPIPCGGTTLLAFCFAVVFVIVSTFSIAAELRHVVRRRSIATSYVVPSVAALVSATEHARSYESAARWILACYNAGVKTWIVGDTLEASLQSNDIYPWAHRLCFAYKATKVQTPDHCFGRFTVNVTAWQGRPPLLQTCVMGPLRDVLRAIPPRTGGLRGAYVTVTCDRKDFWDRLRLPMRKQDVFQTYVRIHST